MMKSSYIIFDTYTPANDRVSVILELVVFLSLCELLYHTKSWLIIFRVTISTRWYFERLSSLVKSSMTNEVSEVGENFDEIVRADVGNTVGSSLQKK